MKSGCYVIPGLCTDLIHGEDTISINNLCGFPDPKCFLAIPGSTAPVRLPKEKGKAKDEALNDLEQKKAKGKSEVEAEVKRRRAERAKLNGQGDGEPGQAGQRQQRSYVLPARAANDSYEMNVYAPQMGKWSYRKISQGTKRERKSLI